MVTDKVAAKIGDFLIFLLLSKERPLGYSRGLSHGVQVMPFGDRAGIERA
jgi:hypothetical protein